VRSRTRSRLGIASVAFALLLPVATGAHVGSPDVFLEGNAGPNHLFVTVRPPHAVPGIADVDIRASDELSDVLIVPLPLSGPGARFAPVPDHAVPASGDARHFTGQLWLMTAGGWQIRVTATGRRGTGSLSVPVPALPQSTLAMSAPLAALLFALMGLLGAGFVAIVAAAARESTLAPDAAPDPAARRRGRMAGTVALALILTIALLGRWWWNVDAADYARYVYKPLELSSSVAPGGSLSLALRDPGWIASRTLTDLVPDHGHLMHLFIVTTSLDHFWHLHPREIASGRFEQPLADMAAGGYSLFADIVHATGVPETATAHLDVAGVTGTPLAGDDSAWASDTSAALTGPARLSDGATLIWTRDPSPLVSRQLTLFTFSVRDRDGHPAGDLELYMGMAGHAIFIRRDLRVFAHVHPFGNAPMAGVQITRSAGARQANGSMDSMPGMSGHDVRGLSTVTFPYGFPEPGDYRIFVQIKRHDRVETGAFDAHVER
jgi:hypothetical protein